MAESLKCDNIFNAKEYIKRLKSIMNGELPKALFTNFHMKPIVFVISRCFNKEESYIWDELRKIIEKCYGNVIVSSCRAQDHQIKLVHCKSLNIVNEDCFYSKYILDCVENEELLDLNLYRASGCQHKNCEPMRVMMGEMTWESIEIDEKDLGDEVSDFSDEECSGPSNDMHASRRVKQNIFDKKYFSFEEENVILSYIIKNKYFYRVKGNSVWKRIEQLKLCPNRTWQSIRQRYIKHIIPKIDEFKIDAVTKAKIMHKFTDSESKCVVTEKGEDGPSGVSAECNNNITENETSAVINKLSRKRDPEYLAVANFGSNAVDLLKKSDIPVNVRYILPTNEGSCDVQNNSLSALSDHAGVVNSTKTTKIIQEISQEGVTQGSIAQTSPSTRRMAQSISNTFKKVNNDSNPEFSSPTKTKGTKKVTKSSSETHSLGESVPVSDRWFRSNSNSRKLVDENRKSAEINPSHVSAPDEENTNKKSKGLCNDADVSSNILPNQKECVRLERVHQNIPNDINKDASDSGKINVKATESIEESIINPSPTVNNVGLGIAYHGTSQSHEKNVRWMSKVERDLLSDTLKNSPEKLVESTSPYTENSAGNSSSAGRLSPTSHCSDSTDIYSNASTNRSPCIRDQLTSKGSDDNTGPSSKKTFRNRIMRDLLSNECSSNSEPQQRHAQEDGLVNSGPPCKSRNFRNESSFSVGGTSNCDSSVDSFDLLSPPRAPFSMTTHPPGSTSSFTIYSSRDDEAILDYICRNDWHGMLGGTKIWKQIESRNIAFGRSWQSIKERFRKTICNRLHLYSALKKEDAKKIVKYNPRIVPKYVRKHLDLQSSSETSGSSDESCSEATEKMAPPRVVRTVLEGASAGLSSSTLPRSRGLSMKSSVDCDSVSGSMRNYEHEEDEAIIEFIVDNQRFKEVKGNRLWIDMQNDLRLSKRTWQSLKNRFLRTIFPAIHRYNLTANQLRLLSSSEPELNASIASSSGRSYTRSEDLAIIKFIVENRRFREVKGTRLWIDMQSHSDFRQRTWQSLKNRFLRNLLPRLNTFNLTDDQLQRFATPKKRLQVRWKVKNYNKEKKSENPAHSSESESTEKKTSNSTEENDSNCQEVSQKSSPNKSAFVYKTRRRLFHDGGTLFEKTPVDPASKHQPNSKFHKRQHAQEKASSASTTDKLLAYEPANTTRKSSKISGSFKRSSTPKKNSITQPSKNFLANFKKKKNFPSKKTKECFVFISPRSTAHFDSSVLDTFKESNEHLDRSAAAKKEGRSSARLPSKSAPLVYTDASPTKIDTSAESHSTDIEMCLKTNGDPDLKSHIPEYPQSTEAKSNPRTELAKNQRKPDTNESRKFKKCKFIDESSPTDQVTPPSPIMSRKLGSVGLCNGDTQRSSLSSESSNATSSTAKSDETFDSGTSETSTPRRRSRRESKAKARPFLRTNIKRRKIQK